MRRTLLCRFLVLLAAGGILPAAFAAAPIDLRLPGTVIILRHAYAPGTSDPAGFDLADCRTQRNLNDAGRAQARALGRQLLAAGLTSSTAVFTSPWCRCQETARLLELAPPVVLGALRSFYANPDETERVTDELRAFLQTLPVDGPPLVLVTHQVNISALTREFMASGEGVVLRLNDSLQPALVGRIAAPRDDAVKSP
jgi:phosphohistidine phosphatase SixA